MTMHSHSELIKVLHWIILLYVTIATGRVTANDFLLSGCTCVGASVMFECTAVGSGATIWRGSAFNCPITFNEIQLLHSQFQDGRAMETCNDGQIHGYASDVLGDHFRSRLHVQVTSAEMNGTTVECEHDNGADVHLLNSSKIVLTTEPLHQPLNIRLSNVSKNQLEFSWDPVAVTCPAVQYNIETVNCGRCPNTTSLTTVTCTDLEIFNRQTCTFGVSTIVCSNIIGIKYSIEVQLEVPDISSSKIDVTPTYDNNTGHLMMLHTQFNKTRYALNISSGAMTSNYTVKYTDADTGESCGKATISDTSCTNGVCSHDFIITSGSTCPEQVNYNVTVFGGNVLGEGKMSIPIRRDYNNSFVKVDIISEANSVLCTFLSQSDNTTKSFRITYFDQKCQKLILNLPKVTTTDNSVFLGLDSLPVRNRKYCFKSTASNDTLTVNVTGEYEVVVDMLTPYSSNSNLVIAISTLFPIIFIGTITIVGVISIIIMHRVPSSQSILFRKRKKS